MLETGNGLMPYGHMIVSPKGSVMNRCISVPANDIGIYGAAQNMIKYQAIYDKKSNNLSIYWSIPDNSNQNPPISDTCLCWRMQVLVAIVSKL